MLLYLFSVLAAPKWVLKQINSLQRNFLWGSSGRNRKWALVSWDTVRSPKDVGGLNLRDPKHNNEVMAAHIWWNWVSKPHTPWAKLWTAKYSNNRPSADLIRIVPEQQGSLIWNTAKQHYLLIQQNNFWEIRNGNSARFW